MKKALYITGWFLFFLVQFIACCFYGVWDFYKSLFYSPKSKQARIIDIETEYHHHYN